MAEFSTAKVVTELCLRFLEMPAKYPAEIQEIPGKLEIPGKRRKFQLYFKTQIFLSKKVMKRKSYKIVIDTVT